LQAKAVRLADHGIAAYATQFFRNLACGHALFPHPFKLVDAFFSP
jgi:hypothetical protein